LGNSIVSGLSTKSNQPGQLSPQTQRELEQAEKSGQVSAELARKVVEETSRGLSVGLKGSTLKVTDGKTDWGGDLNEMTNYGDLMLARRSLLSEFDMSSNSGRALDMGFMQMQAAQMRQMTQTPIEESAAYLQGMARGEARYNHINRDRIAQQQRQVQTTRQLDTLNKQTWQADQARAKMTTLEKVQLGFDIAGMTEIPGVSQLAELGSAGISLYNGDYVGAGLGVASMIPIAGKWAEAAKIDRLAERVRGYSGIADNRHVMGSLSASEANAPHIAKGNLPPYADNTRARDIILQQERVFARVHGEGNQARSWMMRPNEIEGLTAQQIKDKFALPELPSFVSDVHVPVNSKIRVGTVGPQPSWGSGGGIQYELLQRLPSSAFKNMRPLQ
jgi:hypothetical protein